MLEDILPGNVGLPRVSFSDFNLVAVILSKTSELLRIFLDSVGFLFGRDISI